MAVILLERVAKLGRMGEVVRVKDGFARNYLLPKGTALRATEANKSKFEGMKEERKPQSLGRKGEAGQLAAKVDGKSLFVIRQASETGQLFGSVSTRDIATLISTEGAVINRTAIELNAPIKSIGQYKVPLELHQDVETSVTVIVARSEAEAERIGRGEDVTVRREDAEENDAAALANAEAFFEPEAAKALTEGDETEAGPATPADEGEKKPAKTATQKRHTDQG